jgi:hypothetical protein
MSARDRLRAAVAAAGLTVLAATARADAPIDQYGFFDSSAEVIQDLRTGLVWQRAASTQTMGFYDAAAFCGGLSLATPAGQTIGWRVPSYKELLTLVDETPHTEYVDEGLVEVWTDANAFPQTPVGSDYWTSSPYLTEPLSAYVVDFSDGYGGEQHTDAMLYVRCVHDPPP